MREASCKVSQSYAQRPAACTEDMLGATMAYIRAAERGNILACKRAVATYPALSQILDGCGVLPSHDQLRRVRDHAVQLSRTDIWDRIEELRKLRAGSPSEFAMQAQKEHILVRLQRLLPGSATGLNVMRGKDNQLTNTPAGMASILNAHWGAVFSRKDIAAHRIASWLVDVPKLPQAADVRWSLRREHIAKAIEVARESSPGPDGVPYKAWKVLGDLGVDVLFAAATRMQRADSLQHLPQDFNLAFLCCLPKKPSGSDAAWGDFFDAKNTRPLSIGNTDNRYS